MMSLMIKRYRAIRERPLPHLERLSYVHAKKQGPACMQVERMKGRGDERMLNHFVWLYDGRKQDGEPVQ